MGWVALDRAAKLAEIRGEPTLQQTWADTAQEIRADILAHGVSDRGVLRQHYDTDALDASTLLAPLFGFLPGTDERMKNTVDAISSELSEHGFVLRYVTDETDDGLSGKEGTFLICSFWLVSALTIVGEMQRATDLMERLLRIGSPLGLYAEEFEVDRARHLGNFPQAFSTSPSSKPQAESSSPTDSRRCRYERNRPDDRSGPHPGRWNGGRRLCAEAGRRGDRRGVGRPQRLPPVPAVALPGGECAAPRRGHRQAASGDLRGLPDSEHS